MMCWDVSSEQQYLRFWKIQERQWELGLSRQIFPETNPILHARQMDRQLRRRFPTSRLSVQVLVKAIYKTDRQIEACESGWARFFLSQTKLRPHSGFLVGIWESSILQAAEVIASIDRDWLGLCSCEAPDAERLRCRFPFYLPHKKTPILISTAVIDAPGVRYTGLPLAGGLSVLAISSCVKGWQLEGAIIT
jgi:hypothetical protein